MPFSVFLKLPMYWRNEVVRGLEIALFGFKNTEFNGKGAS
jgi:hypothetical protein